MEESMGVSFFELLQKQENEMIQEIMQEYQEYKKHNYSDMKIGNDLEIYSFIPFNKNKESPDDQK